MEIISAFLPSSCLLLGVLLLMSGGADVGGDQLGLLLRAFLARISAFLAFFFAFFLAAEKFDGDHFRLLGLLLGLLLLRSREFGGDELQPSWPSCGLLSSSSQPRVRWRSLPPSWPSCWPSSSFSSQPRCHREWRLPPSSLSSWLLLLRGRQIVALDDDSVLAGAADAGVSTKPNRPRAAMMAMGVRMCVSSLSLSRRQLMGEAFGRPLDCSPLLLPLCRYRIQFADLSPFQQSEFRENLLYFRNLTAFSLVLIFVQRHEWSFTPVVFSRALMRVSNGQPDKQTVTMTSVSACGESA